MRRRERDEDKDKERTRLDFSSINTSRTRYRDIMRRVLELLNILEKPLDLDLEQVFDEVRELLLKLRDCLVVDDVVLSKKISDTRFEVILKLQNRAMKLIEKALKHVENGEIRDARMALYEADRYVLMYYQALALISTPGEAYAKTDTALLKVYHGKIMLPPELENLPETHKKLIAYIATRGRAGLSEILKTFEKHGINPTDIVNIIEDLKKRNILKSYISRNGDIIYELRLQ